MVDLIKIEEVEGIETVNARELHNFLECKKDFSDWIKYRIGQYDFIDGSDFTTILGKSTGGRPSLEYYVSIDMAKELSMVENNEKGKEARKYFIAREKQAKQLFSKLPDFTNPAIAARAWADEVEKKMIVESQVKVLLPKAEFYDQVTGSKTAIDMGHAAKVLDMGIGRNTMFQILRDKGVLMADNSPYQTYIDRGYFRIIEQKYVKPDGSTNISLKTVVYQRGLDYIRKVIGENK